MEPLKEFEIKIQEILAYLRGEVLKIRSNRPNPQMVEDVKVEAYGQVLSVNQLGTISIQPPRDIIITPWDKEVLPAIRKAIEQNNSSLSVSSDSNSVRVGLPALSEERRKEVGKMVKAIAEENKIKMRAVRDKIQKAINEFPEDQKFKQKDELQKKVDKFNAEVDELVETKLNELQE